LSSAPNALVGERTGSVRHASHEVARFCDIEAGLVDERFPLLAGGSFLRGLCLADADEASRQDADRDEPTERCEMGRFSRAAGHGEVIEHTAHELEAAEEQRPHTRKSATLSDVDS
jgi:hypothetical protein